MTAAQKRMVIDTLFMRRPVTNGFELMEWAQEQGLSSMLDLDRLHTTIAFSRAPVNLAELPDTPEFLIIPEGGTRSFEALGDKGAAVLRFESDMLERRWQEVIDAGGVFDFDSFKAHITITWDLGDIDPEQIEPFTGRIVLGPEKVSEVNENWADEITEIEIMDDDFEVATEVIKVDQDLGLVMGFAIVCKKDGNDYFDVQGDHIPQDAMLKAATDFMLHSRTAGEMHTRDDQNNPIEKGSVVFAFPLTEDIAKAFDITTKTYGLMIAMKPDDPAILDKFRKGEFTGFSIGGSRIKDEEV